MAPPALSARGMADVSTILLLMPLMLVGLIALAGFAAVAVGVERLVHWLPPRSRQVQRLVARIARTSEDVADKSVQVIVVPKASGVGGARRMGQPAPEALRRIDARPAGNWKTMALVVGAVVGAATGLAAAFVLVRRAERSGESLNVSTGEGLRLGLLVMGLLREVAALPDRGER